VLGRSTNRFKSALRNHQTQIGLWSSLCSHLAAEVLAGAGFDWIVIDSEHAPNELGGIVQPLQIIASYPVEPVVRIPIADPVNIKRHLDAGARSNRSARAPSELVRGSYFGRA